MPHPPPPPPPDSKMKILLVGALNSTHTIRWANGLTERGHEVVVFSTREPLPGLSDDVRTVVRKGFKKFDYLVYGPALRRMIRDERPDVVHALFASGFGFMSSLWLEKRSYILSMLGSDIFVFPSNPIWRRILRRNLTRAGVLLSTSDVMRDEARKYTDHPIHLTPFGVDMDKFCPAVDNAGSDGTFRIGTVRLLESIYGIDILIEAFALFKERHVGLDVELKIAGDGPERARLESLASRLGVSDCTEFAGWLANDDVPRFLNGLDVFCAPSRYESFGVSVLEASACGLPVVTSNIGGLPEVVKDGNTGFLVANESPDAMADCLDRLYDDESLRLRLGKAGRVFVGDCYNWSDSLDIMEGIYRDWASSR